MIELKQRDLILISYPFSDLAGSKVRPAIIVSNNTHNKKSEDIIVVPLTTNIKIKDYSFILNLEDMEEGELLRESKVKVDRVFSVKKSLVKMKIGTVKKVIHDRILEELLKLIKQD